MKLYNSSLSGNCYKVRLLLSQLRREFETVEIDVVQRENRAKEMPADAPSLRVPLLQLDDGRYLPESNAILCWLARGTDLYPTDPWANAQVLRWMFFEQNHVEPTIAVARYIQTILGKADERPELMEHLRRAGRDALSRLNAQLERTPFLCGDAYTVADIANLGYAPLGAEAGIDMDPYPAIPRWVERIRALPGFVERETDAAPLA